MQQHHALTNGRYGGLKCDLNSRVLSTNDVPIPGLYAAGELTGLFYNEYPPATSCLRSMTFGRIAGAEIAAKIGGGDALTSSGLANLANRRL